MIVVMMEPDVSFTVEDNLVRGVLVTAVMSEKQRPGLWQDMLGALVRGAVMSGEQSVNSFLFQVMTDRLLEEFHAGEQRKQGLS